MSIADTPPQPGSREASLNALNSSRTNAPEVAQVHALLAIAGAIEGLTEVLRKPETSVSQKRRLASAEFHCPLCGKFYSGYGTFNGECPEAEDGLHTDDTPRAWRKEV